MLRVFSYQFSAKGQKMKRIIYKNPDNSIAIITPSDEVLAFATVSQIAEKDVQQRSCK